jgi:hypothetical protein
MDGVRLYYATHSMRLSNAADDSAAPGSTGATLPPARGHVKPPPCPASIRPPRVWKGPGKGIPPASPLLYRRGLWPGATPHHEFASDARTRPFCRPGPVGRACVFLARDERRRGRQAAWEAMRKNHRPLFSAARGCCRGLSVTPPGESLPSLLRCPQAGQLPLHGRGLEPAPGKCPRPASRFRAWPCRLTWQGEPGRLTEA